MRHHHQHHTWFFFADWFNTVERGECDVALCRIASLVSRKREMKVWGNRMILGRGAVWQMTWGRDVSFVYITCMDGRVLTLALSQVCF